MMKKFILALALTCTLPACSALQTGQLPTPASQADQTVKDEQAVIAAHLTYKGWRLAVETGVTSGLIKGNTATVVARIDNSIYTALQTVDKAYATGNATSLNAAIDSFKQVVASGCTTIGGC